MKIKDYINNNNREDTELFYETEINVPESARMIVEVRRINQNATAFFFDNTAEMVAWEEEYPADDDQRRIILPAGPAMLEEEVEGHGAWNAAKAAALKLYSYCS